MAEKKQGTDHSAAHPKDWPGIPGRSEEHEREPQTRQGGSSDVTEQQRELERKAPKSDRPE